jgi:hypothetical protein
METNSMSSSHQITYNRRNTWLTGDMVPCICHPGLEWWRVILFTFSINIPQTHEDVCRKRSVCELRPRGNMPPPPLLRPQWNCSLTNTRTRILCASEIYDSSENKWDLCSSRPRLWLLFFWNATSYTLVDKRFGRICYLHLHGRKTVYIQDGIRTFYLWNYTASYLRR